MNNNENEMWAVMESLMAQGPTRRNLLRLWRARQQFKQQQQRRGAR